MKRTIILGIVAVTAGCVSSPDRHTARATEPALPFCLRSIETLGQWEDAAPSMVGRPVADVPTATLGKPYMTGGLPTDEEGNGYTTYGGSNFIYRVTFDLHTGKVVKFQRARVTYVREANQQMDGTR